MKYITSLLISLFFLQNNQAQNYNKVYTASKTVVDTIFGTVIKDSYRWLENVNSKQVTDWVSKHNSITKKYLRSASNKTNSFILIDKYSQIDYKYSTKKGKYFYNLYYQSQFDKPAIFIRDYFESDPENLLDPTQISRNDVIEIQVFDVSKDSKYLAFAYSRNGSDWIEIQVVENRSKKLLKDHIRGVKFSNIAWLNDGFFYATFEQKNQFDNPINNKVFYHKIGTNQSDDILVFARKNKPLVYFKFMTTSDERFFVIKEINDQKGVESIYYIDYQSEKKLLRPLFRNMKYELEFIDHYQGDFIVRSFKDSNNGSLIRINPKKPYEWKLIAPDYSQAILLNAKTFKDKIVTVYRSEQHPILAVFNYDGNLLYNLDFPIGTSIGGLTANYSDDEMMFYFQSYTMPKVVYKFNINTFKRKLVKKTSVSFKYNDIVYEKVTYPSKDGTEIPMLLIHKKGLKLDGNNPTILKAYGGFGIVSTPHFDSGIVYFIRKGGVFAFANIRGGGDKGVAWARAGKGKNKNNSFEDFIAGAKFLIDKGYTNPKKLASTGASNGGLVVAVAAIQHPDLFKAVVPVVAPLDMLRFEKFTVGRFHLDEYGTTTDSLSFKRLRSYSPYHNIKQNQNYPAMLVITSENDDRVPAFHSYKFVAKLQNRQVQNNPILLKVAKNAGHSGATNFMSTLREKADLYGFIMLQLTKK